MVSPKKPTLTAGIDDNGDFHGGNFPFDILLMTVENPKIEGCVKLGIWSGRTILPELGWLKHLEEYTPKIDMEPENKPSQKESNLPTTTFQGLCQSSGL